MNPAADRVPVIVATGQSLERESLVSALDLAERAAENALEEARGIRDRVQQVSVVGILSPAGRSPATRLSARLGLTPVRCETTTIGGNTPQWLLTRAASAIARGELDAALIVGAEAMRSARAGGRPASGTARREPVEPDPIVGDDRAGVGSAETAAGLVLPVHLYAMFESVLAARAGRTFAEHRRALGRLMAPFTDVAAKHPWAWFREPRTPEEMAEPSPANRIVAEPYTKLMSAFLGGDQGAAVLVTSLELARAAGLANAAVFVWAGADAQDVWFPASRPDLGSSPAIAEAGRATLAVAGAGIDELSAFDLYSCFPSAVQIGAAALGVALDDPRGLTVTGGLPYFGGPGNNYTTHALATMAERLRDSPSGALGLVTGLGWYVTKHSIGLYGNEPPPRGFCRADTSETQERIDRSALAVVAGTDTPAEAIVEASTLTYSGDEPSSAPLIATLPDGRRLVATPAPEVDLHAFIGENLTGARVRVDGTPARWWPA